MAAKKKKMNRNFVCKKRTHLTNVRTLNTLPILQKRVIDFIQWIYQYLTILFN